MSAETKIDPLRVNHCAEVYEDFRKCLDDARTLLVLQAAAERYRAIFPDAHKVAAGMDDAAFLEWRSGLSKQRRKQFAGEAWIERFGPLVMPGVALHTAMIASELCVPFGLAFNRLKEVGKIVIRDGVATLAA
jgi:hypothetical protein